MTQDQKRIKIAEACGWKQEPQPFNPHFWINQSLARTGLIYSARNAAGLPDYFSDLNAMHEAEKMIESLRKRHAYYLNLGRNGGNNHEWTKVHATASQRAEAFGLTLNLWTNNDNE